MKDYVLKIRFISLVNIIAQKEIVSELMGHKFTVENVSKELDKLLNDSSYRQTMQDDYAKIKEELGEPGAAEHCARKITETLFAARY